MTIDEAIKHCEEVMLENLEKTKDRNASDPIAINCFECASEHRQLAEWLKDYKRLLEQEPSKDAVSRKALISHIENQSREWGKDYDAQQILGDIEDMPSVKPQESKWIHVSERLPETNGDYLLFGKIAEYEDTEYIFIGMYDAFAEKFGYWQDYYDSNTLGFLDSELIEYNKVIAWMPLPKPYLTDTNIGNMSEEPTGSESEDKE